jgi:hypothetical protein
MRWGFLHRRGSLAAGVFRETEALETLGESSFLCSKDKLAIASVGVEKVTLISS